MVRLSDLVRAAELASPDAVERAYGVLVGKAEGDALLSVAELAERLKVSAKTIRRHCRPVEVLAGRNLYRLDEALEALRG